MRRPNGSRAVGLRLALLCPFLSQYAGLKHKRAVEWNELDAFACLCVIRLWVPDSLNVNAPSHLFPPQVASERSALVLLGGIYSCCLFILVSPTRGPILVTFSWLKLFKYNSNTFSAEDKIYTSTQVLHIWISLINTQNQSHPEPVIFAPRLYEINRLAMSDQYPVAALASGRTTLKLLMQKQPCFTEELHDTKLF